MLDLQLPDFKKPHIHSLKLLQLLLPNSKLQKTFWDSEQNTSTHPCNFDLSALGCVAIFVCITL